ncbi:MAG TPA: hypothetical protein VEL28_06270 [Candidatus Binatia bacterium]|nr:hypothetical protein [Candidatus Binatia bacterium]
MGIAYPDTHPLKQELARWNQPYVFRAYPRMVYMARFHERGKQWRTGDPTPHEVDGGYGEQFTKSCQRIVQDEAEFQAALRDGWRENTREALAFRQQLEDEVSKAAAERHAADQRLSAKAQAEAKAADEATDAHVPDIPAPKKRGGWRPRKPKTEPLDAA